MLIEPSDTLLIESPAYVGVLAYLRPLGCKLAGSQSMMECIGFCVLMF